MHLSAICVYPLKSGAVRSLSEAEVAPWGLVGDRRFVVVDARGQFVSQRERPALARVALDVAAGRLSFDGQSASVDVEGGLSARAEVWGDVVDARDCGDAAARLVSLAAGEGARVVVMPPGNERPVDAKHGEEGDVVSFADGFPVLVASTSSFAEVARRVPEPVTIDRFRPNLVVDGAPPFAEDGWHTIRVGDVVFDLVKPCSRCAMVDVDQTSGEPRAQVLRALASFRTVKTDKSRVLFGENAIPRNRGTVRLGDAVTILRERPRG